MIVCFIGTTELLLIGGLALLLFGGKKLPEMMRGLGKGVKEFKEGMNEPASQQPGEDGSPENAVDPENADNSVDRAPAESEEKEKRGNE